VSEQPAPRVVRPRETHHHLRQRRGHCPLGTLVVAKEGMGASLPISTLTASRILGERSPAWIGGTSAWRTERPQGWSDPGTLQTICSCSVVQPSHRSRKSDPYRDPNAPVTWSVIVHVVYK
jgi:hypothetical protein